MALIGKIRQFLGLETIEEKVQRYEEINKSFTEHDDLIDQLAKDFFIEKSLKEQRLNDPDNYIVIDKITDKFDKFLKAHKQSIGKAKKEFDSLKKEKEILEKDQSVMEVVQKGILGDLGDQCLATIEGVLKNKKETAYSKIKKAYQDRKISLDSFNTIIKSLTKEGKTKYSDFLLFNENGELLLLQRAKWEDPNHGAWNVPGGHVDPGEDFMTAAKRELVEESGFWVDECENVGSFEDDKVHIEYFMGSVNTNDKLPVLEWEEARDYKWIPVSEIKDEPMIFNMRENIMRILGLVNRHKEIIKKAILEGIISVDDIVKGGKKSSPKLVSKKRLITRDGKTFLTTVYVSTGTGEEVESITDEKEVDRLPFVKDLRQGEKYYIKSSRIAEGVYTIEGIYEKGGIAWVTVLEGGKPKCVGLKSMKFIKKEGPEIGEPSIISDHADIPDLKDLEGDKVLGGSSGVKLMSDSKLNLFAVKKSHKGEYEQLVQEKMINDIYNKFGFKTTASKLDPDAGVLISKYISGAATLESRKGSKTVNEEIQKGFVLDCLLANWDVIGLAKDNILISDGVIRVDNGGCLDKRARGGKKTFGEAVTEIKTMREYDPGKEIYGSITDEEIRRQIEILDKNRLNFLPIKFLAGGDTLSKTIDKRIDWLKKNYAVSSVAPKPEPKPAPKPEPPKEVLRSDMPSLVTQRYFDEKWDKVNISGNEGLKESMKKHILDMEFNNALRYKEIASDKKITVEQVKENMQKWVENIINRSTGYIVAHSSGGHSEDATTGLILKDKRFKTQFETGTSKGSLSSSSRTSAEKQLFGFNPSVDKSNLRPIYGFFTDQPHGAINADGTVPPPRRVARYGDVCFEVKDHKFRKDGTIIFSDSLGAHEQLASTPASAPHFSSTFADVSSYEGLEVMYRTKVTGGVYGSYVETQYHNQLTLDDISKVHISIGEYSTKDKLSDTINEITAAVAAGGKHVPIILF